ncbi:EAL and HDOD domain-containing protein [Lysinibacillus odysseyi]|uniref:Histidine kinase n=1 Tax=Lysinibacillus odysseyi 34hs-1 = NBRC 100172 TaxID=1220589 RepID=A0A0A3IJ55_9BACI|nr:HDOD domain-containing protein [Lysinibacillus odysseyi]KGR82838.1 histidine kinase [Lysinibacillus odysseyi 34hs-1 = NBRC 100172]
MEVFIGRQPIFNLHEQVVAYELLYRNKDGNSFPIIDSDAATVDVLVNSFVNIGVEEVSKGRPSFVNFTYNLLMGPLTDYLEPAKVVIEVLEDVPITEQLVGRLRELKNKGFKIALDDFILDENVQIYDELFAYVDYIKVDFLLSPLLERMEIEKKVKAKFPHIKLLAEKVETRNQFDVARHSGYTLFQGYFFEKPQLIRSTDIPANTLQYFQILALLRDEEPNINKLAESIERDISVSYKLLQLINKSTKRTKSKIRSIKQAILMLGLTELKKWVYLLAMREINSRDKTDVFSELMRISLFRAKVCEKVAKLNYRQNFSEYFLIGLFSLIDSLLRRPMSMILQQLPFSEEIAETIGGGETEMTPYLQFSIALSKADWEQVKKYAEELGLSKEAVIQIQVEAEEWVEETFESY